MILFPKIELDISNIGELRESSQLAAKYNIPALIVSNNIISEAFTHRSRVNGKYKIFSPIDWPRGENYSIRKFDNMTADVLEADGFEILLTPNRTEIDTRNEALILTTLIRDRISKNAEIRFVVGPYKETDVSPLFSGLTKIPTPSIVRNNTTTKVSNTICNLETHNSFVTEINRTVRVPLKISGNVDTRCIVSLNGVSKFGVNLSQLKTLIRENNATR